MFNKLFALTVLTAATCVASNAQNAPLPPNERRVQRMAFGIPSESSYLGVQTENISKENFSKYGLSNVRGVGIDSIVKDSPAAKAGLQKGDVIVKFEGEDVSSVNKLTRLIAETAPDHTAKITILRDGGEREITVTLGKREMSAFQGGNFTFENMVPMTALRGMRTVPMPPLGNGDSNNAFIWRGGANRQIGVGVTSLTRQLGDYFGIAEGKGLLINNVRENSPAAKAGLKAGDVIVEIDGKPAGTMTDLIRGVNEKNEGSVAVTFIRDRNRQTVNITPETVKQDKMKTEEFNNFFKSNGQDSSDN